MHFLDLQCLYLLQITGLMTAMYIASEPIYYKHLQITVYFLYIFVPASHTVLWFHYYYDHHELECWDKRQTCSVYKSSHHVCKMQTNKGTIDSSSSIRMIYKVHPTSFPVTPFLRKLFNTGTSYNCTKIIISLLHNAKFL